MTNVISFLLAIIATFGLYPKTFVVTNVSVEAETQIVEITDFNGFTYEFYDDSEDWIEGDICSCIMYDNKTPEIFDDVILKTRYSGWVY